MSEEDDFWFMARESPIEAMRSPMFALATLAAPERWTTLREENVEDWVFNNLIRLNDKNMVLFAVSCAERVLPLFDGDPITQAILRKAVTVMRAHTLSSQTLRDHDRDLSCDYFAVIMARGAVQRTIEARDPETTDYHTRRALECVLACCSTPDITLRADYCAWGAAVRAAEVIRIAECPPGHAERMWQWNLLLELLRGQND